jgi:hypothetical protein
VRGRRSMNSPQTTLNEFFSQAGKLSPEQLSKIGASERLSSLKEKILEEAKVKWPVAFGMVVEKISDLLDVKLLDIMVIAWGKYRSLQRYLDREKYPPGETFLVHLAEHTIKSEHHPSIQILVNDKLVGKIEFNIAISLMLKGIILKVQDGRIKEIITGTCKGKGTIKCEDYVILEKETESISLPGSIGLGEGVPIGIRQIG